MPIQTTNRPLTLREASDALGLTDLGISPTAVEQIVPDYLRRFRPGGGRRPTPMAA